MIRPVLTEVVLFLTPFALYAIFLLVARGKVLDREAWGPRVIAWLCGAALVLLAGSFVILAEFSGAPPGSTYEPAHVEDGKFVPGRSR